MEIRPIARFRSPLTSKFGVPKQSSLVEELEGEVVFEPEFQQADALRGLEQFEFIWLIWGFSENKHQATSPVVRPPLLGGNEKMGVFATRSPYRPNAIGLSSVRLLEVDSNQMTLRVQGADLMNGTPIYDIKPYLAYADAHPDARQGFVDSHTLSRLAVEFPEDLAANFTPQQCSALKKILSLDPRPHYHTDAQRVYGMPFAGFDVRFRVANGICQVIEVAKVH